MNRRPIHVRDVADLPKVIDGILVEIQQNAVYALRGAALTGKAIVQENTPKASGELWDSVESRPKDNGAQIVVDAPHAVAVELGSMPHVPPLAPLIAWVKRRGMQGLDGRVRKADRSQVRGVRASLKALERDGATPIDAPEQIARAIQAAIAKHGTKPTHFVEKSLKPIDQVVRAQLEFFTRNPRT